MLFWILLQISHHPWKQTHKNNLTFFLAALVLSESYYILVRVFHGLESGSEAICVKRAICILNYCLWARSTKLFIYYTQSTANLPLKITDLPGQEEIHMSVPLTPRKIPEPWQYWCRVGGNSWWVSQLHKVVRLDTRGNIWKDCCIKRWFLKYWPNWDLL